jgi:hypothetical protein
MNRRTKLALARDKNIKAQHAGKRTSADGNTYYEYRENRSDVNRTKRFAKGGSTDELTLEEAKEKFEDSYCVSIPYKYWNYEAPTKRIQKYLNTESKSVGKDLISATWSTNGDMTIISSDSSYNVPNVSEKQYDNFWQERELNEEEEFAKGGSIKQEFLEHPLLIERRSDGTLDVDFDSNNSTGWRYSTDDIGEAVAIMINSKYKKNPKIREIAITPKQLKKSDEKTIVYWLSGGNKAWRFNQADYKHSFDKTYDDLWEKDAKKIKKEILKLKNIGEVMDFYYKEYLEYPHFYSDALENGYVIDEEDEDYAKGGGVGKIKNIKYKDVIDNYNKITLPENVFLKGNKYVGEASIVDGYNGYDSTPQDGLFGVFEPVGVGQNIWNGFKGYLQDDRGFYLRAKQRRGHNINTEDGKKTYAKGGGVGKIRTISNWNELVKAIRFNGGVHNFRGINISSKGEYTDSAIVNFLNKNGFDFQAKEESLLDRSSGKYRLFKIISTRKSDEVKRLALHILEMGLDTEWSAYYEPLGENPTIKSKVEKYGIDLPLKDRVDRLIYANGGGVGDKKVGDTIKIKPSGMSAKIEEVLSYGYEVTSSNGRTMYVDFDFIDFESKKEYAKGGEISEDRINEVLDNYMIAALWSSTDMDTDEPLDANYSVSDIAPATRERMYKDVKMFIEDNYDAIEASGSSDEQLGHDIWLTRNGHGAGFFDRGYDKDVEEKLENAAREMKSVDLEVGDDGMIHQLGVFKKGGKISLKNKYDGHSSEDIWNNWSEAQRSHFLLDHSELLDDDRLENNLGYSRIVQKDKNYSDLTDHTKRVLEAHVNSGQYKKGGSLKRSKLAISRDKSVKALHGGKRVSAEGNVYYENRENRSDVNRTKKFAEGGELTEKEQELKSKIEAILNKVVPNFYHNIWTYKNFFSEGKNLGIVIAASDYAINNVRGQYPQAVSLTLDLSSLELHPQIFGGNGGQSIYRNPNMNDPKEQYLAMKSVKIPFRTPTKEEGAVLKAIEKFAENYKKTLKENIDTLKYKEYVDYDKLLNNEMKNGGDVESEKPYYVYNYKTQNIEKYFDNEIEAEDFASTFDSASVMVNENFAKGGGVGEESNLKITSSEDLEKIAEYMTKAVKKHRWDLKDLIYYFEKDNNFDYKVRVKIWDEMNGYEMPKTYDNILKLLQEIVKGNKEMKNGGGISERFIFGIEYKESPSSRVFKKSSLTMNGRDTKEMNEAINKNAEALKNQEGWFEVRTTKNPILKEGGKLDLSKHLHSGRYISLDITPNGNLKITLDEDGRAEVLEMRDDDRNDDYIMSELFDDVRGNSELMYFDDIGAQGFGLTEAPAITDGFYYDDNGDLTDEGHDDSELYYHERYMIDSFIDTMLEQGYVIFDRAGTYAKGGKISSSFNEDTDSWFDGLSELSSDMKGNEKMDKLLSISDKEASKENIEKFKSILEDCECPKPELKKNIINHLDKVLDSKYKNEFKNSFGGKRNSGGKTSAASEFLSMFNQAATYKFAKGGRVGKNEDVIESFLTSTEEVSTKNLSTHYNEYDKEILLRNYYTLIATRKGDVVKILDKKFSPTTSKIQSKLKSVAKEKGLDIKDVKEFEDGGSVGEFDLVGIEGSILKSLSSGKEVSVDKLTSYLGRKPKFEENVVGFKVRKCFLRPYFKVAD